MLLCKTNNYHLLHQPELQKTLAAYPMQDKCINKKQINKGYSTTLKKVSTIDSSSKFSSVIFHAKHSPQNETQTKVSTTLFGYILSQNY